MTMALKQMKTGGLCDQNSDILQQHTAKMTEMIKHDNVQLA